jgi:hypothetical protein
MTTELTRNTSAAAGLQQACSLLRVPLVAMIAIVLHISRMARLCQHARRVLRPDDQGNTQERPAQHACVGVSPARTCV